MPLHFQPMPLLKRAAPFDDAPWPLRFFCGIFGQPARNKKSELNETTMEMAVFIHEHSTLVKSEDGTTYIVRIYGRERPDGTWEGWLEFHPTENHKSVLRTEQETSQPNRTAVEYWASGLEPIYLEGAFARAQGRLL
jgi:hypothetical protein